MNDPYQVLGVSPTASDEEIKQAYRALAKKYHPDNYAGSPLADLASEKMAEINAAYDKVTEMRKNPGTRGFYGQNTAQSQWQQQRQWQQSSRSSQFSDIRRLINAGRIFDAEQLLDGVPGASRDAEWNFLKGNVLLARGFLDDAVNYLQRAAQMDPQNFEYRATLDQINARRQYGYGGMQGGYSYQSCNSCTTCLCTYCLCSSCCRPCYY